MKKLMLVGVTLMALVGCGVNQAFVKGVESGTSVILPRYISYVMADPDLDEDTKVERIRTAEALRRLINEAKDE